MGKGLRGGIIVGAAVLLAAVVYSALYFQRGLIRFDAGGASIILVLAWAAVVAVLLVVLWQRILVRGEYLRRFYLAPDLLFNFELGAIPLGDDLSTHDAAGMVSYLRDALSGLTYEGSPHNPPEGFKPTLCIATSRFARTSSGEDWRGTLMRIQQREDGHRTFVQVASFEDAESLRRVLEEHGK